MFFFISIGIVSVLFFVFMKVIIGFSKIIFGVSYNPLSFFSFIWMSLICIYILPLNLFYPLSERAIIAIGLGYLSFFFGCLQVGFMKTTVIKTNSNTRLFPEYITEPVLRKILYFTLLCRIGQIILGLKTMLNIAGSFSVLINNSTYVRHIYLSRSDIPDLSLIDRVLPAVLNLTAGVGVIVSAIYIFMKGRRLILPILFLLTSPLFSLVLMSKQSTVIDGLLFLWAFITCFAAYKYRVRQGNARINENLELKIFRRSSIFKVILGLFTLMIILLYFIGQQRGYSEQASPIPMLPKTVAQAIIYALGPLEGLNVTVSSDNYLSLGARTFRPVAKWLISFHFLDKSVLPPFFDTMVQGRIGTVNIYTWLGMFYKDFGFSGILIMPYVMGTMSSYAYKRAIFRSSLRWVGLAAVLGTIISFSFYNWLAQESYYFILPFLIFLLDIFLAKRLKRSKSI